MFHILGILFFIILAILLVGLLLLSKVVGMIFGFKRRMQNHTSAKQSAYSSGKSRPTDNTAGSSANYTAQEENTTRPRKKIFGKEEGEYVEFEEIQ